MRSKWLDWPHAPEIIEKALDTGVTKPAKPSSVGYVGTSPRCFSITREPGTTTGIPFPVSDPYAERMKAALRQINQFSYSAAGMVPWLRPARPDLYAELTAHLPDEIHRLWSERAPLEQFEAVLAQLVSLHRACYELYRAGMNRRLGS
jgi:hypothetical protein